MEPTKPAAQMSPAQMQAIWDLSRCHVQPYSWAARFLGTLMKMRDFRQPLTRKQALWLGKLRFQYRAEIERNYSPEVQGAKAATARLNAWHARQRLYAAFGGRR